MQADFACLAVTLSYTQSILSYTTVHAEMVVTLELFMFVLSEEGKPAARTSEDFLGQQANL